MVDKSDFQADSCFWFYAVVAVVIVISGWTIFLIRYPEREYIPGTLRSEREWPSNIKMWKYSYHSLIPYILWTVAVALFMWGAYHADCRDVPGARVNIYRIFFVIIAILSILSLFLFFVRHNIIAALIIQILILVFILILIFLYSEIDVSDSWFTFPFMLITIYFIYTFWYAFRMNRGHPDIHNGIF